MESTMTANRGIATEGIKGIHVFALILAVATVILLVAGALVTSNEAGDSVPDWPMSFGRWLVGSHEFRGGVRYEYSHRVAAGTVGMLTLVLACWTWFSRVPRKIKYLALAAVAGVVAQAGLGGLRVLMPGYKPVFAVPHALVAQSFFGLIVILAVVTSRSWNDFHGVEPDRERLPVRSILAVATGAVLIQLVLGAAFRHGALGIIPHITGAVVVTAIIVLAVTKVLGEYRRNLYLRKPAVALIGLLLLQLMLGISAYLAKLASRADPQPLEPMISLTVAHVVVGALVLAALLVLTLRAWQVLVPSRAVAES